MTIILAHTSADGLMSYRATTRSTFAPGGANDLAYAGTAGQVAKLLNRPEHTGWQGWGSPAQIDGMFLMTRPKVHPNDVPLKLDITDECGWLPLTAEDIAEFDVD